MSGRRSSRWKRRRRKSQAFFGRLIHIAPFVVSMGALGVFVWAFHAIGPRPAVTPDALWVHAHEHEVVLMLGALVAGVFSTVYAAFDRRHWWRLAGLWVVVIALSAAYDWERFASVIEVVRIHAG